MMCNNTYNSCCSNPCTCPKPTTTSTTTIYIVPCEKENCEEIIPVECVKLNVFSDCLNLDGEYGLNFLIRRLYEKIYGYSCSCDFCGAIVDVIQDFTSTTTTTIPVTTTSTTSSGTTTTTTTTSTTTSTTSTSTTTTSSSTTTSTSSSTTTSTTTIQILACPENNTCSSISIFVPFAAPLGSGNALNIRNGSIDITWTGSPCVPYQINGGAQTTQTMYLNPSTFPGIEVEGGTIYEICSCVDQLSATGITFTYWLNNVQTSYNALNEPTYTITSSPTVDCNSLCRSYQIDSISGGVIIEYTNCCDGTTEILSVTAPTTICSRTWPIVDTGTASIYIIAVPCNLDPVGSPCND
jgi:hypothetical protein